MYVSARLYGLLMLLFALHDEMTRVAKMDKEDVESNAGITSTAARKRKFQGFQRGNSGKDKGKEKKFSPQSLEIPAVNAFEFSEEEDEGTALPQGTLKNQKELMKKNIELNNKVVLADEMIVELAHTLGLARGDFLRQQSLTRNKLAKLFKAEGKNRKIQTDRIKKSHSEISKEASKNMTTFLARYSGLKCMKPVIKEEESIPKVVGMVFVKEFAK